MKKLLLLTFFMIFSGRGYSQMQKIFSKFPYDDSGFGILNENLSGDTLIVFGYKRLDTFPNQETPETDSCSMTSFVIINKKWENVFYQSFKHSWYKYSNYSEGRYVEYTVRDGNNLFDLIEIFKLGNDKRFYVEDTIKIPYQSKFNSYGLPRVKLYKDMMVLVYGSYEFFKDNYFLNILIYYLKDGKWYLSDRYKYDIRKISLYRNIVEINEKFLVIGAWGLYLKGEGNGKVFIYKNSGGHWEEFQQIIQPDPYFERSGFGGVISLSPDNRFLAIGAVRDSSGLVNGYYNRCIYIYKNSGDKWELHQKLSKRQSTLTTYFGASFDINGEELLIGDAGRYKVPDVPFFNKGVVDYYKLIGGVWTKVGEIKPPASDKSHGLFGSHIVRKGETVFVEASADSTYYHDKFGGPIHFFIQFNGAAYIFQIPARDTLRAEICQGQSYTFNDTVIYDEGQYTDTLLASYGVDSVVQLYLTVHPAERVEIDTVLCEKGDILQVGDSILTEAGSYEIGLKDMSGCDSIVTVHLDYESLEVADSITADYGCENGKIDLILQNANNPPYAFSWSGGETTEDISGLSSGVYTVKITDKSGCEYLYEYTIDDSIAYLIPNAFFPSGQEELNKTFRIYRAKDVDVLTTDIYNRWGEKVFAGAENEYWDGMYKGKMQSPGVYLYRIVMDSPCGKEVKTGQVMLLR